MDVTGVDGVSIRGLTVRYPRTSRAALSGVTLEVPAGEIVGVMGLTGSGKSTLLRCLNGIVPHLVPAGIEGSLRVAGLDPLGGPVARLAGRVGMVLDDPEAQISQGTLAEEVALGLESLAVPWTEMVDRVHEALDAVGLRGLDGRSPMTLSGGEQQRLAIACALAMRPLVLVMDEPTANLDPAGRATVFELIRRLNRERGITVVIAEHDVERLAEHAHRLVVLDEGRIVEDGTPGQVLGRPRDLAALGLRVPQVTELAARIAPSSGTPGPLPVTVDAGIAWLAGLAGGDMPA